MARHNVEATLVIQVFVTPPEIPTFEEAMLPLLRLAGDGSDHRFSEAVTICRFAKFS